MQYTTSGVLSKIFKKRKLDAYQLNIAAYANYFTDVSNKSYIDYYDSLTYDSKKRIAASYRMYYDNNNNYQSYISYYYKFSYQPANDSLLSKVELYNMDTAGNFRVAESLTYTTFDNRTNPFFKGFSLYGLLTPYVTHFYNLPNTYSSSLPEFLNATPYNCNKIVLSHPTMNETFTSAINYTYNTDSLPIKAYYAGGSPGEYVQYFYRKVQK